MDGPSGPAHTVIPKIVVRLWGVLRLTRHAWITLARMISTLVVRLWGILRLARPAWITLARVIPKLLDRPWGVPQLTRPVWINLIPKPVVPWAVPQLTRPAWISLIRVILLLTLIPASWLGIIAIPHPRAVGVVLLLGGYVIVMAVGPRWASFLRRADVVLVLDLVVITLLLLNSGSVSSPFLYLYYLVILEAAVWLNLRQAVLASTAAAGLLILLWTQVGRGWMLGTAESRLSAFIGGGFLLALIFGMLAQEYRAGQDQIRWTAMLDWRLREATAQLEVQLGELQFYNDLASRLSGELRMDGVMEILLQAFLETTGLTAGFAHVVGEDDVLHLTASHGLPLSEGDQSFDEILLLLPPRGQVAGGEVTVIAHKPDPDLPGSAAACVPVVRAGHLRAWLCGLCDPPLPLEDSARRRLVGMAAQGVSALEAARLHEEVQRMIRTDPTRSLHSWSRMEQIVAEEVERSKALPLVFSLAEIQLEDRGSNTRADSGDHDLALRRIVKLLQASLRRVDVVAHDGAGRFAVLLPRVPKIGAMSTVQALVQKLEEDSLAVRLLAVERLVISAAVVTFPEDGTTASSLLFRLEELLLQAPSSPARVRVSTL